MTLFSAKYNVNYQHQVVQMKKKVVTWWKLKKERKGRRTPPIQKRCGDISYVTCHNADAIIQLFDPYTRHPYYQNSTTATFL